MHTEKINYVLSNIVVKGKFPCVNGSILNLTILFNFSTTPSFTIHEGYLKIKY